MFLYDARACDEVERQSRANRYESVVDTFVQLSFLHGSGFIETVRNANQIASLGGPTSIRNLTETTMKILMVVTSHDQVGNARRKTGFWLENFAAPYFVFRDAGVDLTLASPKGGQPPIDPKSDLPENQTAAMARFKQDKTAQAN